MTNALRSSIHQMAAEFAASVLKAIRGASLEDILTESQGGGAAVVRRGPGRPRKEESQAAGPVAKKRARGGRLGRRSASDIAAVVKRIVTLLDAHPKGLRAEEIRATLNLQAKELPRPIAEALSSHKISKTGAKRATTYFAGKAKAAPAAKAGKAKRSAKTGKAAKAT